MPDAPMQTATARQSRRCFFQGLGPRLTGDEVPAVDKDRQATLAKRPAEPLHRIPVGATVAYEDIEGRHIASVPSSNPDFVLFGEV